MTFNDLMSFEQATNGFMARAMIFNDLETNPKRKNKFKKERMSENLATNIRNLYAPGVCDTTTKGARVEFNGEKMGVPTTDDGAELLEMVYERFHEMADAQKGATGLEAIPRRGYELAAKVSWCWHYQAVCELLSTSCGVMLLLCVTLRIKSNWLTRRIARKSRAVKRRVFLHCLTKSTARRSVLLKTACAERQKLK